MRALAVVPGLLLLRLVAFHVQAPQVQIPQTQTQAQQRPVFRGGTRFVRVDAYPTSKDGRIVEGLKPEDFEITEDGKPQTVDSLDFIRFDTFTPETERRNPSSQREGFELAADPRYRVFVIFVDMRFSSGFGVFSGINDMGRIQQPLVNFIDRVIGVHDLFGLLSSRNKVSELVLGQKTTVTDEQVKDLWRASHVDFDPAQRFDGVYEPECVACRIGKPGARDCNTLRSALIARYEADQTYTGLRDLLSLLGAVREERKNVVFVSNQLARWREDPELYDRLHAESPKLGIDNGRIDRGDPQKTPVTDDFCVDAVNRLPLMDFERRYQQVLTEARQANVAFDVIPPSGLQAVPSALGRLLDESHDSLIELARETGGIAVTDSNDLNAGLRRIADDLQAYYVLGYYTTNTKFDGRVRKIGVKLKGETIRARREYRAPTQAEINALAATASAGGPGVAAPTADRETALAVLERASRPFASYTAWNRRTLTVVTELSPTSIRAARWKSGADVTVTAVSADGAAIATAKGKIEADTYAAAVPLTIDPAKPPARISVDVTGPGERPADDWQKLSPAGGTLVADPIAYRSASRVSPRPVAAFEFARNQRIRIEWPVLAPALDRREARLLDKTGKPLPVDLSVAEDPAKKVVLLEMSLSGLPHGDYLFELTVGAGADTERHLLAIRIAQ
jgi:VWFA-related protein